MKQTNTITTYAGLGRFLGVTRQRAHQLAHAFDWSFGPPPWPADVHAAIRSHYELQAERPSNTASTATIEPRHFRDSACIWCLRPWLGEVLDAITDDALANLAGFYTLYLANRLPQIENPADLDGVDMTITDTLNALTVTWLDDLIKADPAVAVAAKARASKRTKRKARA